MYYLTAWEIRSPKWVSMTKTKVLAGLYSYIPSGGSKGESVFSPFPGSGGYMCSLAPGPRSSSKPAMTGWVSHCITLTQTLLPPSPPLKDPSDYIRPNQITQDTHFIFYSTDYSHISIYCPNSPLLCNPRSQGLRYGYLLGGHYSA